MTGSNVQPAPVKGFLERLQDGVVVGDGAMGTMLYARGVFVNRCFDELNLSNPALVRAVHEEYLDAGADIIETNTFGAQRFKLGPHGFEAQVRKINREGARGARGASPWSRSGTSRSTRPSPPTRSKRRVWPKAAWTSSRSRRSPPSTRRG